MYDCPIILPFTSSNLFPLCSLGCFLTSVPQLFFEHARSAAMSGFLLLLFASVRKILLWLATWLPSHFLYRSLLKNHLNRQAFITSFLNQDLPDSFSPYSALLFQSLYHLYLHLRLFVDCYYLPLECQLQKLGYLFCIPLFIHSFSKYQILDNLGVEQSALLSTTTIYMHCSGCCEFIGESNKD